MQCAQCTTDNTRDYQKKAKEAAIEGQTTGLLIAPSCVTWLLTNQASAGARRAPYNVQNVDPVDAVNAHGLYDPHMEPQESGDELEDPSMVAQSGVGYELEKRDEEDEGSAATSSQLKQESEDEELEKEESIDEAEEAQHGKHQQAPKKLEPEEAKKLLLSISISAHAAVPDLLGTKTRLAKAEGKPSFAFPVALRTHSSVPPVGGPPPTAGLEAP
ncbi:uncharacterized protein LOC113147215 [Cyclospora cayetanensis]|uniref:Uncharacterized protein LOC113147215 n=1 Tax=Cyclospora cayetanensis TaxID=88456 RepID=A0A6P6S0C9_9EIME|nr:uncharacterized protein LOC113147215 [Cyclospora cayetanensis]